MQGSGFRVLRDASGHFGLQRLGPFRGSGV